MGLFRRKRQPICDLTGPTDAERETIRRVRAVSPGGQITFGAPSRCPECASYGYVELVDDRQGRVDNRCPACAAIWTINRQALAEAERADRAPSAVRPIGSGLLVRDLVLA